MGAPEPPSQAAPQLQTDDLTPCSSKDCNIVELPRALACGSLTKYGEEHFTTEMTEGFTQPRRRAGTNTTNIDAVMQIVGGGSCSQVPDDQVWLVKGTFRKACSKITFRVCANTDNNARAITQLREVVVPAAWQRSGSGALNPRTTTPRSSLDSGGPETTTLDTRNIGAAPLRLHPKSTDRALRFPFGGLIVSCA